MLKIEVKFLKEQKKIYNKNTGYKTSVFCVLKVIKVDQRWTVFIKK